MPVDEQESTDDRREYAWESGLQIQMQGAGSSSSSSAGTEWGREMSRERSVVREDGYSDGVLSFPPPLLPPSSCLLPIADDWMRDLFDSEDSATESERGVAGEYPPTDRTAESMADYAF